MAVFRILKEFSVCARLEKAWQRRRLEGRNVRSCRLCLEPLEVRAMPAAGTWQPVAPTNPASGPTDTQIALLLSDGTLMIQPKGIPTSVWDRLTPDANGNYAKGTWSPLASMNEQRYVFASAMLQNGKVFVLGGAHSSPDPFTNTAEIFDPTAGPQGAWKSVAPVPTPPTGIHLPAGTTASQWGEGEIEVIANGDVFASYFNGANTYIYNPSTNTWTAGGQKLRNDTSGEEHWVKLPDNSLLSYDLHASLASGVFHGQRYFWNTGHWVDESKVSATNPPQLLSSKTVGNGDDNAFELPDRRIWFAGGDGNSAYFTPSTDTWSAGPVLPSAMYNGVMTPFGATDNPGAMLPNGDVLIALSPAGPRVNGQDTYPPTTRIFEFNPLKQTFTDVTPPGLASENAVYLTMLNLPTGQILLTNEFGQMQIYTPTGVPVDWWRPTISGIQKNANGSYTLTGTELNGISEGSNAGDDWQMATNYPIVQLKNATGQVFYARTYNWSSTGIAPGNIPRTVNFQLPAGLPAGSYSLSVSANGIASQSVTFINPGSGALGAQVFANTVPNGAQHPGQPGVPGQNLVISSAQGLPNPNGRGVPSTVAASDLTSAIALNAEGSAVDGERHVVSHRAVTRPVTSRSADSFDILARALAGLVEEDES
jgi:hypothetical protein